MEELLERMLQVDGVLGTLLLSQDGLTVASANLEVEEADLIGALATAMITSMRATTDRLAVGALSAAQLRTDRGVIDLYLIQDLILLILSTPQVDRSSLDEVIETAAAEWLEFAL